MIFLLNRMLFVLIVNYFIISLCQIHAESVVEPEDIIKQMNLPSSRIVHKCHLTKTQYPFNVLPGSGWDNLANKESGQVYKISYDNCSGSNDGRFLIPDSIIITPYMKSKVQMDSDMVSHFSKYTSTTSKSINLEVSASTPNYEISGSFSWEKKDIKENQMKEKSSISKVQLRYELYHVAFQPDSKLDPIFKNRIIQLGVLMETQKNYLYSQYLADLIVRDYGTHVIRSVDAGAILSKVDILKAEYLSKHKGSQTTISLAASGSLNSAIGLKIGGSNKNNESEVREYNKNCASSKINTIGGGPYGSNFQLAEWEKTIQENLVPIDRIGDPLFHVITKRSLPEFDDITVYKIGNLIKDAITRYYKINTRSGCMDIKSDNFDVNANVNNGICQDSKISYVFGGVYQTCEGNSCENLIQTNPATGSTSCPAGYNATLVYHGLYSEQTICTYYVFSTVCNNFQTYISSYWCAPDPKKNPESVYLFGGFYSKVFPNPITNSFTCPQSFIALRFGHSSWVCVTSDSVLGRKFSLPFGGFYSCMSGNALVADASARSQTWAKSCPPGYSAHFAFLENSCQISYCLKANSLKGIKEIPLYRPPFITMDNGPNVTDVNKFKTSSGVNLVLSKDGLWKRKQKKVFTKTLIAVIILGILIAVCIIMNGAFGLRLLISKKQK